MKDSLIIIAYIAASVLFIMSLGGLSRQETARRGNLFGILGMLIALIATAARMETASYLTLAVALIPGAAIGALVASRVQMTSMPQLVAMFHSLVGLAAVLVAAGAFYAPEAFGIEDGGAIHPGSIIEMSLGLAIGAVTFTGSIIAFLKLDGRMSGAPILLPQRHLINGGLGVALVLLIVLFYATQAAAFFWLIALVSFALGILLIVPIGGADMPVVIDRKSVV